MVSAVITSFSVKCGVRRDGGSGIPEAPVGNFAAGLRRSRLSGLSPGTAPAGASGMTVIRSGSAERVSGGRYGGRTPT